MAFAGLKTLSKRGLLAVRLSVFLLCLAPAVALVVAGFLDRLGADPVERLLGETGESAIRMLVATLAITPLRHLLGWNWLLKLRRMLGLYVFFYVFAHFSVYVVLDRGLDPSTVIEDILERKFITVGMAAWILLCPLALTSTSWAVRKMGARRWLSLHKSVYAIAVLASAHFLWLVKGEDIAEPLAYALIFAALLLHRYMRWVRSRAPKSSGEAKAA